MEVNGDVNCDANSGLEWCVNTDRGARKRQLERREREKEGRRWCKTALNWRFTMESVRIWEGRQRNDTRTVTDDKPVKISHRREAKSRERALKSESSSLMLRLALALPLATGPWNMIKIFVLATIMRPSRSETHKKERNNKQKTMTEKNREEQRREREGGEVRPSVGSSVTCSSLVFYDSIWKLILWAAAFRKCSEVSVVKTQSDWEPRNGSFLSLFLRAPT